MEKGEVIALLAPASAVKEEYCDGAEKWLTEKGFRVKRYPSARGGESGSYAATREERIAEMADALFDPEVKAILCGRGGYGCIQLLEEITPIYAENKKPIIGFSDVSALHAMAVMAGGKSIHAPMAKHLTEHPNDRISKRWLATLLSMEQQKIEYYPGFFSQSGVGEGILVGGNLAVLNSLADTPWDVMATAKERPTILVLEDISEAIYAVERMLYRLHYSGVLSAVKGLIIGQFTEYRPDRNYADMEKMIVARLAEWGVKCPIAMNFPVGHVTENEPLVMGSKCRLIVGTKFCILQQADN